MRLEILSVILLGLLAFGCVSQTKAPQAYALTQDDMPGFVQMEFRARNTTEVNLPAIEKGWKSGFLAAYNNTTTQFAQFISIYPKENISKVFNTSEITENETVLNVKPYGDWSMAILYNEDGEQGMNLIFLKGELYETLYVSGNSTAELEWYAQKAYAKAG